MQSYTHFTLTERESLRTFHCEGKSIRQIAVLLGRSPSSISRELARNKNKKTGKYNAWGATSLYLKRRKRCRRKPRLSTDVALMDFVQEKLWRYWSPELITVMWKQQNPGAKLAHTTIYSAIGHGIIPSVQAKTHLRRRGGKKYRHGASNTIQPDRFIKDRCEQANLRLRIGDWEGDTLMGGINKGCLLTFVDRKSRYCTASLVKDKQAAHVTEAFSKAMKGLPVETITLDNGSEFAEFRKIEKMLQTEIYFADPKSPWQRGSNENTNGLLRFFFPKGCDFNAVTEDFLDFVLELINHRPRKCLDWLSPADFFLKLCCT